MALIGKDEWRKKIKSEREKEEEKGEGERREGGWEGGELFVFV